MVLGTRAHDGAAAFSSQFNVKIQENLMISANLIKILGESHYHFSHVRVLGLKHPSLGRVCSLL